jgi:hypothetical protein
MRNIFKKNSGEKASSHFIKWNEWKNLGRNKKMAKEGLLKWLYCVPTYKEFEPQRKFRLKRFRTNQRPPLIYQRIAMEATHLPALYPAGMIGAMLGPDDGYCFARDMEVIANIDRHPRRSWIAA